MCDVVMRCATILPEVQYETRSTFVVILTPRRTCRSLGQQTQPASPQGQRVDQTQILGALLLAQPSWKAIMKCEEREIEAETDVEVE